MPGTGSQGGYDPAALGQALGGKLTDYANTPVNPQALAGLTGAAEYATGFNPTQYLQNNDDVAANATWAANPFAHYLANGQFEGRDPGGGYGNPLQTAYQNANALQTSGGLTPGLQSGIDTTNAVGQGFGGIAGAGGLNPLLSAGANTAANVGAGFSSLAANGGLTPGQSSAISGTNGLAGAFGNLAANYGQGNPYFEADLAHALNTAGAGVNAAFNNSGRFGSSLHADQLATTLGNVENTARMQQRDTALNQQLSALGAQQGALGQAFSMGQTGVGNQIAGLQGQLSAGQTQAGIGQNALANTLSGLQGQQQSAAQSFGMGQQGITNQQQAGASLPALYAGMQLPAQQVLDNSNQDFNRYLSLLGAFTGSQNNAGMQQQVPWWSQLLGGLATTAGIVGSFI